MTPFFLRFASLSVVLGIAGLGLPGCVNQPIKPPSNSLVERSIPKPLAVQGAETLAFAVDNDNPAALDEAIRLLTQAHEQAPDNVLIQLDLYRALYTRSAKRYKPEPDLLALYQALSPEAKDQAFPPRTMEMPMHAYQPNDDSRQWMLDLLKDNPNNYQAWTGLLLVDSQLKHDWMALIAAKKIQALSKETTLPLAKQLEKLANRSGCRFDQAPMLRSAGRYYAQTAAKTSDAGWYEQAADVYLAAGQYPLAYISAQKSLQLDPDGMDAETRTYRQDLVIHAARRLGKQKEAHELAMAQAYDGDVSAGHYNLALLAMAKGDKAAAARHFTRYTDTFDGVPFTLVEYLRDWIYRLGSLKAPVMTLEHTAVGSNPWHSQLVAAVEAGKGGGDPEQVLKDAVSGCEKTEAHFYAAYLYWLRGDIEQSKRHLSATSEQTATGYTEHAWAEVLRQQL